MIKESLTSLVDKVIGKTGQLHSPAWWMHRIFSKVDEELTEVDNVANAAKATADKAQDAADGNTALLGAITASAVWPKPNDTAPLRIVATQDKLQAVVSRGELVWAAEDADVIKFVRAEGGTGTATVALNTTDKNYSLTLGAGEGKAVLPATITDITTSADNDIEHVRLRGKLQMNGLQFNQKFPNLKTADLAGLDMSGLTRLNTMFRNCANLLSADLRNWDTSKITAISHAFLSCTDLLDLNMSGWDTSKVADMSYMLYECRSLTSLDLSGWDTSAVTNMAGLFYQCRSLTSLDLSGWDTSAVTNMQQVFYECRSLTSLDLSGWDTSAVTNMYALCSKCSALTTLKFGTWDMSSVTNIDYIFDSCSALTTVTGTIAGIKLSLDLSSCPLTNASAMVFINGLAEVTTAQTITFKATTYATLTEEQLAIATSKGWTVASA